MNAAGQYEGGRKPTELLKGLDYSVLQQCMHCGMCLPTCPTYDLTGLERHSPRGRIALMRAIADDKLPLSPVFGEEMYFCLGCLACKSACPAGVDYPQLFEVARAEIEASGVLNSPLRRLIRWVVLKEVFSHNGLLHAMGRALYLYQASGLQGVIRHSGILKFLPNRLMELERLTPKIQRKFSQELIQMEESPSSPKYLVGFLTGCVQEMLYADVNRQTVDVLLAAGCEVLTPRNQLCCGSLHAHNGELELAKEFARKLIDQFPLDRLDAIISNAGGCGSHLRNFDQLLVDDPEYAGKARVWSAKLKDIHEWLVEIGFHEKLKEGKALQEEGQVTYHDSCHLCHGQGIVTQPRLLLKAIPGIELVELPEASRCCGSAGIYNLTQPEAAMQLAERKLNNILKTGCTTVAAANPGCLLQLQSAAEAKGVNLEIVHPVTLIARHLT